MIGGEYKTLCMVQTALRFTPVAVTAQQKYFSKSISTKQSRFSFFSLSGDYYILPSENISGSEGPAQLHHSFNIMSNDWEV